MVSPIYIVMFSLAILLFGFLNGYRFALSRSEKKLLNSKNDPKYKKLLKFYRDEEAYTLSFLFLSIFGFCLYATTFTIVYNMNLDLVKAYVSPYTNSALIIDMGVIFLATLFLFIWGWLVPRLVFRLAPVGFIQFFYGIADGLHVLFYPIAKQFYNFSRVFVKEMFNEKNGLNEQILKRAQLSTTVIDDVLNPSFKQNKKLLNNAYDFQDKKAKYVATPRNEIAFVLSTDNIDEVQKAFNETQLSKLIVCEETIDNIIGYVHFMDMLSSPSTLAEIIISISAVPEGMPLPNLLEKLKDEKQSIAWVIDEFGGTTGIVTMEDIYEELFGDIKDEHDHDIIYLEKKESDGNYLFSGRLELSYIREKYGFKFKDDLDVDTLSGYVIQHTNEIPKTGDKIIIDDLEFNILQVKDKKIESLQLIRLNN